MQRVVGLRHRVRGPIDDALAVRTVLMSGRWGRGVCRVWVIIRTCIVCFMWLGRRRRYVRGRSCARFSLAGGAAGSRNRCRDARTREWVDAGPGVCSRTLISTVAIGSLGLAFVRPPFDPLLSFLALTVYAGVGESVLCASLTGAVVVASLAGRRTVCALEKKSYQ